MKFQCRSSFVSCFINDCNASLKSADDDAGFGDTGNTEKDLDIIQKNTKKERKGGKKTTNKKNLDDL